MWVLINGAHPTIKDYFMSDDIFAGFGKDGIDPFASESTEDDTSSDSQADTNDDKDSPSQEGDKTEESNDDSKDESKDDADDNTSDDSKDDDAKDDDSKDDDSKDDTEDNKPFHEHPRWKQRETDWQNRFTVQEDKFNKDLEEIKASVSKVEEQTSTDVDPLFVQLYGDNKEAHAVWQQMRKQERASIIKEIQTEQTKQVQAQEDTTKKWNNWVESEISNLVANGEKFDRNALMKVALDFKPTDDAGNLSFSKALEILNNQKVIKDDKKKEKVKAKKDVADKSASNSKGEPTQDNVPTSASLRNKSWY